MGIDIYAQWRGQTVEEISRQSASWLAPTAGNNGYLREAYHGVPYATMYLCNEAFDSGQARIPAAVLRERLAHTLALVEEREQVLYNSGENEIEVVKQSFEDFVALCEQKEEEAGEPVLIVASY